MDDITISQLKEYGSLELNVVFAKATNHNYPTTLPTDCIIATLLNKNPYPVVNTHLFMLYYLNCAEYVVDHVKRISRKEYEGLGRFCRESFYK